MMAFAERSQAKKLIDFVPDDKITYVVRYIQSFTDSQNVSMNKPRNSKKEAYEALLADVRPVSGKAISLNGMEEVADIIARKYESLD